MAALWQGVVETFQPDVLMFLVIGTVFGFIIGALPGLTGNMAIALMVPITFAMRPVQGLAFLSAIYCSSIFGGSTSAILLGIPGTISSFATTLDGYPMAKMGQAGKALGIATLSSAFGGIFSSIVLMTLTNVLADFALQFGPAEYFAVAVLGLSCIATLGGKSISKGLISGMLGLLISCIGMDPQTGIKRFTFGNVNLLGGIGLVASLMGIFGVVSILKNAEKEPKAVEETIPQYGTTWIGWRTCWELLPLWLRHSVIGTIIGIIPGTGTNVATFLSYDLERKISKNPNSFGQGNPKGVAAPETSNNAVTGGSMVPLLSLGVPGNATSALFLGAIMIQGMRTGPVFFAEHPDVINGLYISFLVANLIMAPLGLFLLKYIRHILSVPESLLGGIILVFCVTGVYSIAANTFDILVLLAFGLIGYVFYKFNIPTAPMIVAMVLGGMTESNLRQALVVSNGSINFMWKNPIAFWILLISIFSFAYPFINKAFLARKAKQKSVFNEAAKAGVDDDD